MKKYILVTLAVFILVVCTGFAYKYFGFADRERPIRYEQMTMGEYLVNLQGDQRRYLRTQIVIEYIHTKDTESILNNQIAKAKDSIISVLRSKTVAELSEPGNFQKLRDELRLELETALGLDDQIVDLWFIAFVIQ